jgi:hypothetical protein
MCFCGNLPFAVVGVVFFVEDDDDDEPHAARVGPLTSRTNAASHAASGLLGRRRDM